MANKPTIEKADYQRELHDLAIARDGHAGLTSDVLIKLAEHLELGIHQVQSIALGRKRTSVPNQRKILTWVRRRK